MLYYLYRIVFPNDKYYFGISRDVRKRFSKHLVVSAGTKLNFPVYQAIRKYRPENVRLETLCIGTKSYIADLEIKAIARFCTTDRKYGYNLTLGGETSPMQSPEVAAKVGAATKKRFAENPEALKRLSDFNRGRKLSEEHRKKLSASHIGLKWTDARKEAEAGRVRLPWNKGVPPTEETLGKNRDKALARYAAKRMRGEPCVVVSEEQKRKISRALMGHPGAGKGEKRPEIGALISSLKWITNGSTGRRIPADEPLPNGWRYGKPHTPSRSTTPRSRVQEDKPSI